MCSLIYLAAGGLYTFQNMGLIFFLIIFQWTISMEFLVIVIYSLRFKCRNNVILISFKNIGRNFAIDLLKKSWCMSLEIKSVDYMLNLPLKSRAVFIRVRIKLWNSNAEKWKQRIAWWCQFNFSTWMACITLSCRTTAFVQL